MTPRRGRKVSAPPVRSGEAGRRPFPIQSAKGDQFISRPGRHPEPHHIVQSGQQHRVQQGAAYLAAGPRWAGAIGRLGVHDGKLSVHNGRSTRPGRWRSGAESKQRIVAAARVLFREHGYAGTGVRAVAAEAGVDPAMVFYFFDTKQGLFAAAIEMSAQLPPAIDAIFTWLVSTASVSASSVRCWRTRISPTEPSSRCSPGQPPPTTSPKRCFVSSSTGRPPADWRRCSTLRTPRCGPAW